MDTIDTSTRTHRYHYTSWSDSFEREVSDFSHFFTWWKKFEKATFLEKNGISYIIANICDNIASPIYKRKSKSLEDRRKESSIEAWRQQYPPSKSIFLAIRKSHIRKGLVRTSCIRESRKTRTQKKSLISLSHEKKRIEFGRKGKRYDAEIRVVSLRKIWGFHAFDQSSQVRSLRLSNRRAYWRCSRARTVSRSITLWCNRTSTFSRTRSLTLWSSIAWTGSTLSRDRRLSPESDIIGITKNISHKISV